ncbi:hypothetical protein BB561_006438 [Smittium simulii]|uniref:Rho-GAP domain-containing protein n=1 Tax=Smittium simulii TaxID=133385 RepID=A0A2T9Y4E2_9FUNG|nr:hypothetical protein BB561_006438 [Smittium simulii]
MNLNEDLKTEIIPKLVQYGSLDFESKPLIVFSACYLPDPKIYDYDFMVKLITFKLDAVVESDYSVVLFAGGSQYNTSITWLISAYQALKRDYKKNLKTLYIVHASFFTRLVFRAFAPLVSYKFAKKLFWIGNLYHLKFLVPMKTILVPQRVKEFDLSVAQAKIPQEIINKQTEILNLKGSLFKINISELLPTSTIDGTSLYLMPEPIIDWILYLYKNGINVEGLFRRSPSSIQLGEAKNEYNCGIGSMNLDDLGGVHVAAVLLKMFFKELPDPIFDSYDIKNIKNIPTYSESCDHHDPTDSIDDIFNYARVKHNASGSFVGDGGSSNQGRCVCCSNCIIEVEKRRIEFIQTRILCNKSVQLRQMLAHIFGLLYSISLNSAVNKMTSTNLSLIWSPNLYFSDDILSDVAMYTSGYGIATLGSVLVTLIQNFQIVFAQELSDFTNSIENEKPTSTISTLIKVLYTIKKNYIESDSAKSNWD